MNGYEIYYEDCEKCSNKGILKNGHFCDCSVGMAESLMGVSAEADEILRKRDK